MKWKKGELESSLLDVRENFSGKVFSTFENLNMKFNYLKIQIKAQLFLFNTFSFVIIFFTCRFLNQRESWNFSLKWFWKSCERIKPCKLSFSWLNRFSYYAKYLTLLKPEWMQFVCNHLHTNTGKASTNDRKMHYLIKQLLLCLLKGTCDSSTQKEEKQNDRG